MRVDSAIAYYLRDVAIAKSKISRVSEMATPAAQQVVPWCKMGDPRGKGQSPGSPLGQTGNLVYGHRPSTN